MATELTDQKLADLTAVAEAATQGDWAWDARNRTLEASPTEERPYSAEALYIGHDGGCGCRASCEMEIDLTDEDRAFMNAFGPATVRALLEEVTRLRGN